MRKVFALVLCAVFAGCAKSPESIAPAYVSSVTYRTWSCADLAAEASRQSVALSHASVRQNQARTNDTVGVILLGLPVASMTGDNIAPEIARLKGEQEAVRIASIEKNCQRAPSS